MTCGIIFVSLRPGTVLDADRGNWCRAVRSGTPLGYGLVNTPAVARAGAYTPAVDRTPRFRSGGNASHVAKWALRLSELRRRFTTVLMLFWPPACDYGYSVRWGGP